MHYTLPAIFLSMLLLATVASLLPNELGIKDRLDLTEGIHRMQPWSARDGGLNAVQELLHDQHFFLPSREERDTVVTLLHQPRPISLLEEEVKFLESLLDTPTWTGFDQRIVHAIAKKVTGGTRQSEE